jgi:hypothetical protein
MHTIRCIGWCHWSGFDRERWKRSWEDLFATHELVRNRRQTLRVAVTEQRDGGFAVVDVDTLWRNRQSNAAFHWKGRACKVYTKVGDRWFFSVSDRPARLRGNDNMIVAA